MKSALQKHNPSDIALVQQVLHFSVADTEFCLALQHVRRVFPIVQFRYVPGGPEFLRGLMTLAGKSLPVIDLADFLNLSGANQYHLETPILLCQYGEKAQGIIVDKIYGVEEVDVEHLQMRPLFDKGNVVPFDAAIKTSRGTSLLLDIDRIMNLNLATEIEDLPEDPRQ